MRKEHKFCLSHLHWALAKILLNENPDNLMQRECLWEKVKDKMEGDELTDEADHCRIFETTLLHKAIELKHLRKTRKRKKRVQGYVVANNLPKVSEVIGSDSVKSEP